MSKNIWWKMEK